MKLEMVKFQTVVDCCIVNIYICSLRLYYDHGECIAMRTIESEVNEVQEIVSRLENVCYGCEVNKNIFEKSNKGPYLMWL